jgi:tetratricopeptide (TPR) repeat protein
MKTELTKAFTWLWLCLLSLIAIPSCSSRPHIDSRLIEAEHIVNAHPDSALQMVRGFSSRNSVDSAYALYLAARAKDKLHIRDVDVDSLQEAVDYLETLPLADEEKALMHYYTGINYYRKDSLRRSVQEYYKCLDYQTDTCTKLGYKTYEYLGECFYEGHLYKEALEYYKTAASVATRLNDTLGMCILEDYVAFTHFILEDYDSAVAYCNHSIQLSEARSDSLHLATSYNTKAAILDHLGRVEEALRYTNKAFSFYPKSKEVPMAFYITKCDIWIHMNRWDSVEVCLRHWQDYKENQRTLRDLYERYYRKSKQDSVSAVQILYADSVMHYQEQYSKDLKQVSPILQRLHDSYQTARQQHSQAQADIYPYIIGVVCVLFFLVAGGYLYMKSSRNKVPKNQTDETEINLLQQEPQIIQPDDLPLLLQQAKNKLLTHPDFIDLSSQNNYSASAISKEDFKKMNAAILTSFSDVNVLMRKKYPSLGDSNQFYCFLLYLGYKTQMISTLMECTENAIYQRKHRVSSQLDQKDAQMFFC